MLWTRTIPAKRLPRECESVNCWFITMVVVAQARATIVVPARWPLLEERSSTSVSVVLPSELSRSTQPNSLVVRNVAEGNGHRDQDPRTDTGQSV